MSAMVAVAAVGWHPAALSDNDVGWILQEVEAGQHAKWKNTTDHNPAYKT
jgi:hypothetical protein